MKMIYNITIRILKIKAFVNYFSDIILKNKSYRGILYPVSVGLSRIIGIVML